jgi:hypothetical protein
MLEVLDERPRVPLVLAGGGGALLGLAAGPRRDAVERYGVVAVRPWLACPALHHRRRRQAGVRLLDRLGPVQVRYHQGVTRHAAIREWSAEDADQVAVGEVVQGERPR